MLPCVQSQMAGRQPGTDNAAVAALAELQVRVYSRLDLNFACSAVFLVATQIGAKVRGSCPDITGGRDTS